MTHKSWYGIKPNNHTKHSFVTSFFMLLSPPQNKENQKPKAKNKTTKTQPFPQQKKKQNKTKQN